MFLDNAIFGTRATITRQIFDTLPVRFLTTLITLFLYAQIINLSIKLLDIFFKKFNIKINNTLVKKIVYILIIGMVFLGSSIKIEHAVFGRGETYKSKEELCNEIQASYLNTVIKTQRLAPVDNEYQMALYVEGNLYNLCMIDLNEKKLREFKLSDINQLPLFVSEQPRNKIIEYTVGNTEAIKDVANKFNISVETIRWENQLETDDVYVGQTIRILPVTGVSHKVVKGDTIYSVAKKYHTDPQKISDYPYNKFANNETLTLIPDEILIIPEGVK